MYYYVSLKYNLDDFEHVACALNSSFCLQWLLSTSIVFTKVPNNSLITLFFIMFYKSLNKTNIQNHLIYQKESQLIPHHVETLIYLRQFPPILTISTS